MKTHWQILVVDDEEVMCESLAAWLREDGYVVDTASSGHDAVEKARLRDYAIYFVDLKMPGAAPQAAKLRRAPVPKRGRVYVAVHRHDNMIYSKRIEPAAYRILRALRAGRTIAQAVANVRGVTPEDLQAWFKNWVELGWFCRPS